MLYTSSEANKLLTAIKQEIDLITAEEEQVKTFVCATVENVDDVRPAYDYDKTQQKIDELYAKMRKIKHAINCFNVTHVVDGLDMTVDQILVYLPQLTKKVKKLKEMSSTLPKTRARSGLGEIIEYSYANYNPAQAADDYRRCSEELTRVQTALDVANNTVKFEIDI